MSIPLTIIDGTFTRDENLLEYTVKEDGGDEWDLRAHTWEDDGKFHGVVIIKGVRVNRMRKATPLTTWP